MSTSDVPSSGSGLDRMRRACELAHPFKPPGAVLVVEPHNVFSGVSDERPLRDDGIALRLTGVLDDARAFIAGDEPAAG